jgi:hypothetical protein
MKAPMKEPRGKRGLGPLAPLVLLLLLLVLHITQVAGFVRLRSAPAQVALARRPLLTSRSSSSRSGGSRLPLKQQQQQQQQQQWRRHGALPERQWQSQQRAQTRLQATAAAGRGGNNDLKEKAMATLRSLYFPLLVLGAGVLGAWKPAAYAGISEGFVTRALAAVMVLMGATLTLDDFKRIGRSRRAVLLGWVAQFSIMPTMALLVSRFYRLPPHLAAGVVLVGCCPGGTASNLVTLLAEADVALSVTMTAVSTMSAGVMTPLLTSRILGELVPVDTRALVVTTLQVVLLPVIVGLLTNTYLLPRLSTAVTRQLNAATPVLSGAGGGSCLIPSLPVVVYQDGGQTNEWTNGPPAL